MADLTIQPDASAGKDTYISEFYDTTNYGTSTTLEIYAYSTRRAIIAEFDASTLIGAELLTAKLCLYYYEAIGTPSGHTLSADRIRRSDWAETQATWNRYKTGTNWGTFGALNSTTDYDSTYRATASVPASAGAWIEFDIASLLQDALANYSGILRLRIGDLTGASSGEKFYSSDYTTDTTKRPKLVITYNPAVPEVSTDTVDDINTTVATLNGTVVDDKGFDVNYYGFIWDTSPLDDPGDSEPVAWASSEGLVGGWKSAEITEQGGWGENPFDHAVSSGLTIDTVYYVRACAHNSKGWSYGPDKSFRTAAYVQTLLYDAIFDEAILRGKTLSYIGALTVSYLGFVYGKTSKANPGNTAPESTTYDAYKKSVSGNYGTTGFATWDEISGLSIVTGLDLNTTYYYRAAACVDSTWYYGDEVSFETINPVDTLPATSILSLSATIEGITASMPDTFDIDYYGFVWDTVVIADPGNTDPDSWTPSGSGDGWKSTQGDYIQYPSEKALSSLSANTVYYFRAACRCGTEWYYGEQLSFQTLGDVTTAAADDISYESATLNGNTTEATSGKSVDRVGFVCSQGDISCNFDAVTEALSFDGTDDYASVAASTSLNCGNYVTVECWIKPTTVSARKTIYSHGSDSASGAMMLEICPDASSGYGGSGSVGVYASGGRWPGYFVYRTVPNVIVAGELVHVAYTRNYATHKIYVNGILVDGAVGTGVTFTNQTAATSIGRRKSGSQYFNGVISDLRIWNYARSESQIQINMHTRLAGTETGLKAYWKMNEYTGSTLNDSTSNNNDATASGTTWTVVCAVDAWVSDAGSYAYQAFDHSQTGILSGVKYYVKAFARVDGVWKWGQEVDFTTLTSGDISTLNAINIGNESARFCGETTAETVGDTVDYVGFVWDTVTRGYPGNIAPDSESNEYDNSYVFASGNYVDTPFGRTVFSLTYNTLYYFRAAAKVNGTWYYGIEKTFKTVAVVGNPYETINWATIGQYKTQLHCHTNESDGSHSPADVVDYYEDEIFNVLCLTDHSGAGQIDQTTQWPTGHGTGMIHFLGTEQSTIEQHTPAWFSGYLHSFFDHESALAKTASLGGMTEEAHPSWHKKPWSWYIDDFENFSAADGLLGVEVYNRLTISGGNDESLWDSLTDYFLGQRNVWGFAVDDMHSWGDATDGVGGNGWVVVLLASGEETEAGVKNSLRLGKFYWCYRYSRSATMPVLNSISISGGVITVSASNYTQIDWVDKNGVVKSGTTFNFITETYTDFIRIRIWNGTASGNVTPRIGTQPILKSYLDNLILLTTLAATEVTTSSAKLNGQIDLGETEYVGFVWDTTSRIDPCNLSPTDGSNPYSNGWVSDVIIPPLEATDTFNHTVSITLTPETAYYARAAVKSYGNVWTYGDEVEVILPSVSVSMSGSGSLTAIPYRIRFASVGLSGIGSLSGTSYYIRYGTVSMTGVGSMTPDGLVDFLGAVDLSGIGNLAAFGHRYNRPGTVAMSGIGTLSAVPRRLVPVAVSLSGIGELVALCDITHNVFLQLSGVGSMGASGHYLVMGHVSLSGTGDLVPDPSAIFLSSVGMSGVGSIILIPSMTVPTYLSLSGSGMLAPLPRATRMGGIYLSGLGSLALSPKMTIPAAASLSGVGSISTIGEILGKIFAGVSMSGVGSLAALPSMSIPASLTLSGVGNLAPAYTRVRSGVLGLSGVGEFGSLAYVTRYVNAVMYGAGSLSIAGKSSLAGVITLTGMGDLIVSVLRTGYGAAIIVMRPYTSGSKLDVDLIDGTSRIDPRGDNCKLIVDGGQYG